MKYEIEKKLKKKSLQMWATLNEMTSDDFKNQGVLENMILRSLACYLW